MVEETALGIKFGYTCGTVNHQFQRVTCQYSQPVKSEDVDVIERVTKIIP